MYGVTTGAAALRSASAMTVSRTASLARNNYTSLRRDGANTTLHNVRCTTVTFQPGRRMATIARSQPYEAVVVGAGPAGITCLGNLLERDLKPILWVDDGFDGGRINRMYREVPSNTKVKLFTQFAEAVAPFRNAIGGAGASAGSDVVDVKRGTDKLHFLRELEQEKGCRLSNAADMCLALTDGLKNTAGVETEQGRVSSAILNPGTTSLSQDTAGWTVNIDNTELASGSAQVSSVQTKRLVFCTGASPNNSALPVHIPNIRNLDLDTALSPSKLRSALSAAGSNITISVIGASHSAVIVLMNLYSLAASSRPDLRVRWFTRHALRYAQEMDGWILRDNTGLKGEAAAWAKANLEPDVFPQSDASKYFERIQYPAGEEEAVFEERMVGSQFYVQAIGYSRDPLPELKTSDGRAIDPVFDHERGTFNYVKQSEPGSPEDLVRLPGLFGAGIAFPERVKDPHGNVEMAVGFFKFMKFVKRVSPEWN